MIISRTTLATLATVLAIFGVGAHRAPAAGVSGGIGFFGTATSTQVGGLNGSSTLSFDNPLNVDIRLADYTPIAPGTPVNFAPISWTGSGSAATLTSSNTPEWTISVAGSVYQYSIIALSSATMNVAAGTVSISGLGIATISGVITREPTYIDFSVQGTGSQFLFTVVGVTTCGGSPCPTPRVVPDAGSAIELLGIASIALGLLRRRWHASA